LAAALCATAAWALDAHRSLTQYSRKIWTQAEGWPQDTVRSIAIWRAPQCRLPAVVTPSAP